ncbi:Coenzyme F420 hydrogenase/dehydrogenase, beta subunit C-terminal domain [Ellagibacter isourolithinifaciens]|uniref:Coenzyme F420 hydrogenase/dehydrogenase, beta subunit C-terminal domain n=1 Tax=Ellagibacter isourolithinifaciens TaxID=2137581 RepID=UPI003AAEC7BE
MPLAGLYTCDLICWGAASPMVFADYLRWLEGKFGSEVVAYRHRAKGDWEGTRAVATLADGREVSGRDVDLWARLWYGKLCRPSCGRCGFHSTERPGDVTIGDYWGLDAAHPGLEFGDGTSCLLVNSEAGAEIVATCSGSLRLVPSKMGLVANDRQPMLLKSPEPDADRDGFWRAYWENGFEIASERVGAIPKRTFKNMAKGAAKRALRSFSAQKSKPLLAVDAALQNDGWKEAELNKVEKTEQRWPMVYAAKNVSDEVRRHSASGGMFHALASSVISVGGVVYGCAFDNELCAVHIRCETMAEAENCMGSKYSQSRMGNVIKDMQTDLKSGRIVLFTGTPCEVAAVNACCRDFGKAC